MKIYNKLVRDRIPELIENCGKTCVTHIITDKSVRQNLLRAKLLEVGAHLCVRPFSLKIKRRIQGARVDGVIE